uniref:Uncharacterized protein n=1 Tax=Ditylenchus dipsaci TaxID=166011 RepID=A0A915CR35_9BILA
MSDFDDFKKNAIANNLKSEDLEANKGSHKKVNEEKHKPIPSAPPYPGIDKQETGGNQHNNRKPQTNWQTKNTFQNDQQQSFIAMAPPSEQSTERRYTLAEVICRVVGFFGLIFLAILFFYIAFLLDEKDKTINKHIDCLKGTRHFP